MGPGKDTHGALGPGKRGGRGSPTPTPKGRSTVSMTRAPDSTKHKSSDKQKQNLQHFSWVAHSSAEVENNTPLKNLIWSNSLPKKQCAFTLVKKIPTARENPARATYKRTKFPTVKRRTARGNPARIQPKCNHQVATERRPSLKKQFSDSCTSTERTTSRHHERQNVASSSGFTEIRSQSEAAFEESTDYSSTRNSSSRTR